MQITIEFGKPMQWKPGIFRSKVGGEKYTRVWFWYMAISWTKLSAREWHDAISSGNTTFICLD